MPALLPRLLVTALAAALVLSVGPPPAAPAAPVGQPQLVSPDDGGDHYGPDLALDGAGGALLVWQATGGPPPGSEIFARRIGPDGAPIGPPLPVNAGAAGEQRRPAVAGLSGGGFVVVWDTNTSTVWARRIGPDGAPSGAGDLAISPADDDSHFDADVAALPDGSFAVAWERESLAGVDVLIQRFGPDDRPAGPAQTPYTPGAAAERRNPAIATGPDGALTIVWEEATPLGASAIRLTRYDAAGQPAAIAVEVASADGDALRDPAVAVGPDGTASVAWVSLSGAGPTAGLIEQRRLEATGEPLGPELTVSGLAPAERTRPSVAVSEWGTVVVWSDRDTTQGGAPVGLAARALAPDGAIDGDELYPRLPALGGPTGVVAAAAAPSAAWVAWSQDTVSEGIEVGAVYARRLADDPASAPPGRVLLPLVSNP